MEERCIGEVTRFFKTRGFGFITGDGLEFWFHVSEIQNRHKSGILPVPGDMFVYSLRPSPKVPGRSEAFNLVLARRASSVKKAVVHSAEEGVSNVILS